VRKKGPWFEDAALAIMPADKPHFLERIPYTVFAFESELKLETVRDKLRELSKDLAPEQQVDSVFMLDRGCVLNFRAGEGNTWAKDGKRFTGFCTADSKDHTVLEMMRWICTCAPRVIGSVSPLMHYLPREAAFVIDGDLRG